MKTIKPFPVPRERHFDLYSRIVPNIRHDLVDWSDAHIDGVLLDPHCWIFTGAWEDGKGFKKVKFDGHTLYVHRAMYEIMRGPVPAGLVLDHRCRRRACCHPDHLEPVTTLVNTMRGRGAWIFTQGATA